MVGWTLNHESNEPPFLELTLTGVLNIRADTSSPCHVFISVCMWFLTKGAGSAKT